MTTSNIGDDAAIRAATSSDLAAVEQLLASNHLPTAGVAESLAHFFVAEHGDALVGVAGIEECGPAYGLLRSVAVDHALRSRGLGRQLVERAIADAEHRGLNALYLLTTTAERYFPSFGFTEVEREVAPQEIQATAEFRGACPASATLMTLSLARRGNPVDG